MRIGKFFGSIVIVISAVSMATGGEAAESKIRIGVMNFSTANADSDLLSLASMALLKAIEGVGIYEVYSQVALEDIFAQLKCKFPARCHDVRCIRDVGRTAGMDRMLSGVFDKNGQSFGIRLDLLDVASRQIVESVNLESRPGTPMEDVVTAAVEKLHGHGSKAQELGFVAYDGPEVHNERQWGISTALCLGAGLVWTLANGNFADGGRIPSEFVESRIPLSGIAGLGAAVPRGGRPAALANCYIAVSDDAYGILYNPAGVAWVPHAEVLVAYQRQFGFIDNVTMTFVNRATREIGFGHAFCYVGDTEKLMTEVYFTSAVAYRFRNLLPFLRPLSVGASFRVTSVLVKAPDDVFSTAHGGGSGWGVDAGLLWEIANQIRYGLTFKDVLSFLRWNNVAQQWVYGEFCPPSMAMGGAFKAGYTTLLVANGQIPLYEDQPWKMAGGIEQELFRMVKVRLGLEKQIQAELETPWRFTGGAGIEVPTETWLGKYAAIDVSYEYNYPLVAFYLFNISIRFGF